MRMLSVYMGNGLKQVQPKAVSALLEARTRCWGPPAGASYWRRALQSWKTAGPAEVAESGGPCPLNACQAQARSGGRTDHRTLGT